MNLTQFAPPDRLPLPDPPAAGSGSAAELHGPCPLLTGGIGLKSQHYAAAIAARDAGLWFEVHPENYFVDGGPRLAWLDAVRAAHPLSLHGVSLSLGGAEAPDKAHLKRLRELVRRFEPTLVSEHLAWSRQGGVYFPDLLPLPRTTEALLQLAANIDRAQSVLGRAISIENPSHYLRIEGHDWHECEFLAELARRTGCGLLLDVNNVFVSANNLGFNAADYLDRFPVAPVTEIHLAGHTPDPTLGAALLVDSHDMPVAPEVWALYEYVIQRIGARPTLIERDGNVPDAFEPLLDERMLAAGALRRAAGVAQTVVMNPRSTSSVAA